MSAFFFSETIFCLIHVNYSTFWMASEHGKEALFCYFVTCCTYRLIAISSKFFRFPQQKLNANNVGSFSDFSGSEK